MWLCEVVRGVNPERGGRFCHVRIGGDAAKEGTSSLRPGCEAWPHQGGALGILLGPVLPPWLVCRERCSQTVGDGAELKAADSRGAPNAHRPPLVPLQRHCLRPASGFGGAAALASVEAGAAPGRWGPAPHPEQGRMALRGLQEGKCLKATLRGRSAPPAHFNKLLQAPSLRFPSSGELSSITHELLGPGHSCLWLTGGWSGILSVLCFRGQ